MGISVLFSNMSITFYLVAVFITKGHIWEQMLENQYKNCMVYLEAGHSTLSDAPFTPAPGKIFRGRLPDPNLREGVTPSTTLPLSALRASVNSASLVTCAPAPGSGGSGSAPVLRVPLSLYLKLLKWLWYVYLL